MFWCLSLIDFYHLKFEDLPIPASWLLNLLEMAFLSNSRWQSHKKNVQIDPQTTDIRPIKLNDPWVVEWVCDIFENYWDAELLKSPKNILPKCDNTPPSRKMKGEKENEICILGSINLCNLTNLPIQGVEKKYFKPASCLF